MQDEKKITIVRQQYKWNLHNSKTSLILFFLNKKKTLKKIMLHQRRSWEYSGISKIEKKRNLYFFNKQRYYSRFIFFLKRKSSSAFQTNLLIYSKRLLVQHKILTRRNMQGYTFFLFINNFLCFIDDERKTSKNIWNLTSSYIFFVRLLLLLYIKKMLKYTFRL